MQQRTLFTGLATLAGIALAVTGCGGGSSAPSAAATASPGAGGAAVQMVAPGTSGTLAAISGSTLQVQNSTDGQVGVTYSPATTFSRTVAATAADVKVGVCVTAAAGGAGRPGTPSSAPSAAPSGPLLARTVTISSPVNGQCTNRAAGGVGRGAGGTGASRAPGAGTASNQPRPGGARGGFGGFGAFGKVTARTATGFVVQDMNRSGSASTTTVTTDSTTTYQRTVAADAKALSVGECVTALGRPDQTGTVAATAIAIRPPGPQGCSVGFRGRPGGSGQGAGSGG
jgi:hypothetical protein